MNTHLALVGFIILFCCGTHSLMAENMTQPLPSNLRIQNSVENALTIKNEAAQWGLSFEQFTHYQWLMQHPPSGQWYKNLDPTDVLALNSHNADEMLQYAKSEATLIHERVSQELAFNILYAKAYQATYPQEKPIMPAPLPSLSAPLLEAYDRVWLFVDMNSPLNQLIYQQLIKTIHEVPHTTLDIYFVGRDVSPARIQGWAVNSGIFPPG